MHKAYRFLRNYLDRALHSLAALPVPMTMAAVALGILLFYLEGHTNLSGWMIDTFPALEVRSQDTARSILGILVGGLFTLTVFTFTQVMSLLNNVANSYSPRLLPWMTGDRSLQFVMGTYLSSIVLTIIVFLSIKGNEEGRVANFSVLVCVVLTIFCLGLFLYFVTTISRRIQVSSIIQQVYQRGIHALNALDRADNFEERSFPEDTDDWYTIPSPISGFVGSINYRRLSRVAAQVGSPLMISVERGHYIPKGLPLIRSRKKLSDTSIEEVMDAVSPVDDKFENWYLPHLRILTEIVLKAMSPGINDPGTAIDALDRISGLLGRLMSEPFHNYCCFPDDEGKEGGSVYFVRDDFGDVLTTICGEVRTYANQDPLVTRRLLQLLYHLRAEAGLTFAYSQVLHREIRAVIFDCRKNFGNPHDRQRIAADIRHHRNQLRRYLSELRSLKEPEPRLVQGIEPTQ